MKNIDLEFPEKYTILSKEEMEKIEGGKKDTIAKIQDILEKLLSKKS